MKLIAGYIGKNKNFKIIEIKNIPKKRLGGGQVQKFIKKEKRPFSGN